MIVLSVFLGVFWSCQQETPQHCPWDFDYRKSVSPTMFYWIGCHAFQSLVRWPWRGGRRGGGGGVWGALFPPPSSPSLLVNLVHNVIFQRTFDVLFKHAHSRQRNSHKNMIFAKFPMLFSPLRNSNFKISTGKHAPGSPNIQMLTHSSPTNLSGGGAQSVATTKTVSRRLCSPW